ncbi:MAG: hypothetical protein IPL32_20390 [Chloracidobacterium sp.]|nr:hypothetical protein [Chloracidobacterium sp.]
MRSRVRVAISVWFTSDNITEITRTNGLRWTQEPDTQITVGADYLRLTSLLSPPLATTVSIVRCFTMRLIWFGDHEGDREWRKV